MSTLNVLNSPCRGAAFGLLALSSGPRMRPAFSELRSDQLWPRCGGSFTFGIRHLLRVEDGRLRRHHFDSIRRRKSYKSAVVIQATDGGGETGISDEKVGKRASKEKIEKRSTEIRTKITEFLEKKSVYSWLLGPAAVTAAIVVPSTSVNLLNMFQNNFFSGLVAILATDILFVLAADLFLVLADKLGHHQQVSGGPPPWIGPWEYTGYPTGYPTVLNYVSYGSVGVGILAAFLSLFTGKFPGAVAVFGPYLGLIFAQVAYERLLGNDRSPMFPLVPLLYTVYRFRQLSRALELLPFIADGSGILTRCVYISASLWALYLATFQRVLLAANLVVLLSIAQIFRVGTANGRMSITVDC